MSESDYWSLFAIEADRIGSPLYASLARHIRDDLRIRTIAEQARPGQPHANIILGAVHYLLYEGRPHALKNQYPSLTPGAVPGAGVYEIFRDFCLQYEQDVTHLVTSRVTNTNEVARCTALLPGFQLVARETGSGLHMIEIGPSAGFNLNWDLYAYEYMRDGRVVAGCAAPDARLRLTAEARGPLVPRIDQVMPVVQSRLGLELNPVRLSDPADRLWLKALIFPELLPRIARLEAAVETAMQHPPPIRFGDALELVTPVLRSLPASGTPVVYHSFVTYQFSTDMQRRFDEALLQHSMQRPLYRVSIEWEDAEHPVRVTRYENGARSRVVLADCNPHGAWIEWRHRPGG
jgi:hypothetical protein